MNKIKLLILDDHQIVRDGLSKLILDEPDLELTASACSGKDALTCLESYAPDIVIADLSMPDMSGLEFTNIVSARYPDIKVIILSMHNDEDYILNAIKSGAKGYLSKQDSTSEILLDAIRTVHTGEEYFSQSISRTVMKSYASRIKQSGSNETPHLQELTQREREILKLYVEGMSNDEIASKLFISVRTVKTHKNNIMLKFNFKSNVDMIKYALKNRIVEL
jgi:DNA-binding NarL/FixJ family response regulator